MFFCGLGWGCCLDGWRNGGRKEERNRGKGKGSLCIVLVLVLSVCLSVIERISRNQAEIQYTIERKNGEIRFGLVRFVIVM